MRTFKMTVLLTFLLTLSFSSFASDEAKTQEVNFSAVDIEGKVRNPDGAYLVQKKGIDFVPLYKMKSKFHRRIKDSVHYLR